MKYTIFTAMPIKNGKTDFTSPPDGFVNIVAMIAGMRVKKTKCFCLCGAYDKMDSTGFAIGRDKTFTVPANRQQLYFFCKRYSRVLW